MAKIKSITTGREYDIPGWGYSSPPAADDDGDLIEELKALIRKRDAARAPKPWTVSDPDRRVPVNMTQPPPVAITSPPANAIELNAPLTVNILERDGNGDIFKVRIGNRRVMVTARDGNNDIRSFKVMPA